MSTRHLMSIGMGTVALLLAASVGVVFTSLGDKEMIRARVDLAASQPALVQDLTQQVQALADAGNLIQVNQARQDLGKTILHFDQNLTALLHGGTVTATSGEEIKISSTKSSQAKDELETAAELWVQAGLPLADLAAGEFSIFSSAGQKALAGLQDTQAELRGLFEIAATSIEAEAKSRHLRGNLARWFALGFTAIFIGMGISRFKPQAQKPDPQVNNSSLAPRQPLAPQPQALVEEQPSASPPATPRAWNSQPHQPFASPVDFDNVNASVDQLSVDMNTIANSTSKMQMAIDSVGHAMQGMLFSLNQMAQDTAEGYKIVRGANNAATYTHSTAGELAESAQEMSRVVARVTQLALKTKQVAGQIEAEAVHTGSTGEAFTSVVAGEVKGLADQTSQATAGIEQTVADILGTARQYEEAIGQILKNISAINKVSENFGELMLQPPAAGVAGTPLPSVQVAPLTPQPVTIAETATIESKPVAETVPAPKPEPAPTPPAEPAPELAAQAPETAPETAPEIAPETAPEPETDDDWGAPVEEPSAEKVAEETSEAIEETAADPEPSGSAGNVFMLGGGGPKKAKALKPAAEPEKKAEAEPAAEAKKDDGDSNIFMLNKPAKANTPKEEKPAKTPVETPPESKQEETPPEPEKEDEGSNIFMLNKPAKAPAAKETTEETEEEKKPVTVPADDPEEEKDDGGGNIFMLNKPKK